MVKIIQPIITDHHSAMTRIAHDLYRNPVAPTQNQKWKEITAKEAPLVRSAIVRGQSLTILKTPAATAYMQGITDALAFIRRTQ